MPLAITEKRKQQRKVTIMSFGIAGGIFAAAFIFLKATGLDEVVTGKIIKVFEAIQPPPPPPPPPPEPKANIKAPPPIDPVFKVKTPDISPDVDPGFDLSALSNMDMGMSAPDLSFSAMTFTDNSVSNLISSSLLGPQNIMQNLEGFADFGPAENFGKASAVGTGKRTSGSTVLTLLDIPGIGRESPTVGDQWTNGELDNIVDYISTNTSMRAELGSRSISFIGLFRNFDFWLENALERVPSGREELPRIEPEINALKIIANILPSLTDRDYEEVKQRVYTVMDSYFRYVYRISFPLEEGGWLEQVKKSTITDPWEEEYIPGAEESFIRFYTRDKPSGKELQGIYQFFRIAEMTAQQLPILFCEPRGKPSELGEDNIRLLRTYINNGGFIYFINTSGLQVCRGVRALISEIIQEEMSDPVGEETLEKLRADDRDVSGYEFRQPEEQVFHPWTFCPMILPRNTDVAITFFNRIGNTVFTDTIQNIGPGVYLQKNKHYRWFARDNLGNDVGSGYYIYQASADLASKTWPVYVSFLRRLPDKKHPVFSSYFPIDQVPSSQSENPEQLPYGEFGVFGYTHKGRLSILYTEGYKEKELLKNEGKKDSQKEAALKWVTNVVIQALQEGSIARR